MEDTTDTVDTVDTELSDIIKENIRLMRIFEVNITLDACINKIGFITDRIITNEVRELITNEFSK